MEFFRVSKNAWGQETLIGVSWNLVWWFVGAALLFVALHMIYKWLFAPDAGADKNTEPGEKAVS